MILMLICSHSLVDEVRVLLVHGILHLCGLDHERGPEDEHIMAAQEQRIMAAMGWRGAGLIEAQSRVCEEEETVTQLKPPLTLAARRDSAAKTSAIKGKSGPTSADGVIPELGSIWAAVGDSSKGGDGRSNVIRRAAVAAAESGKPQREDPLTSARSGSPAEPSGNRSKMEAGTSSRAASDSSSASRARAQPLAPVLPWRSSDVRLVALDMDGTLLDSRSKILPSSVQVRGGCRGLS